MIAEYLNPNPYLKRPDVLQVPGRARMKLLSINWLLPASGRQPQLRWFALNGRRGLTPHLREKLGAFQCRENQSGNIVVSGRVIRAHPAAGVILDDTALPGDSNTRQDYPGFTDA